MKLSPKFSTLNRGKISTFSIHFDPHRTIFFAGQTICGYVLLELKGPMEMRGIYIKLSGKATVEWKSSKKRHTETDVIVDETIVLMDGMREAGTSKYLHPEGTKRYPFSFQLSPQLPSSFEGRHGTIQYLLKAKIEKAWKLDQKVERSFIVHQRIDPNEARYIGKMKGESEKEVTSACFLGGSVQLCSSLERSCYCTGEHINIDANIVNSTRKNMGKVRAKLVQNVAYTAQGGTKAVATDVTLLVGPRIGRNTNVRWTKQSIEIPSFSLPPTITNCKLIVVQYHLFVLVGKSQVVGNQYEIVVGTVPYIDGTISPPPESDMVEAVSPTPPDGRESNGAPQVDDTGSVSPPLSDAAEDERTEARPSMVSSVGDELIIDTESTTETEEAHEPITGVQPAVVTVPLTALESSTGTPTETGPAPESGTSTEPGISTVTGVSTGTETSTITGTSTVTGVSTASGVPTATGTSTVTGMPAVTGSSVAVGVPTGTGTSTRAGAPTVTGTSTRTGTTKRRAPFPPQWSSVDSPLQSARFSPEPRRRPLPAQQSQGTQTQTVVQQPPKQPRLAPQPPRQQPQQQTQATQTTPVSPSAPPLSKAFSDPSFGVPVFSEPPPYYPGPNYATESGEELYPHIHHPF